MTREFLNYQENEKDNTEFRQKNYSKPQKKCRLESLRVKYVLRPCLCTHQSGAPFMCLHTPKRCSVCLRTYSRDALHVSAYIEAELHMSLHISEGLSIHVSAHMKRCSVYLSAQVIWSQKLVSSIFRARPFIIIFFEICGLFRQWGHIFQKKQLPDRRIGRYGSIIFPCVHLCTG